MSDAPTEPAASGAAPAGVVPGAARARVAIRSLSELSVLTALAVGGAVWLALRGQGPAALGLAVGHGTGLAIAALWIVATAAAWSARPELLLRFTLGLWPLRLLVFVAGAYVATRAGASGGSFLFSLVGTHVAGTLVEARTLAALTGLSRVVRPLREGSPIK